MVACRFVEWDLNWVIDWNCNHAATASLSYTPPTNTSTHLNPLRHQNRRIGDVAYILAIGIDQIKIFAVGDKQDAVRCQRRRCR